MRVTLLSAICLSMLLAGCQTEVDPLENVESTTALSPPAASAIAGDLSGRFAEQAGPPSKAIRLHDDGTAFAAALQAALRGWGYQIADHEEQAPDKGSAKPIELSFALANLDGQILARLSSETLSVSRVYSVTASGATPQSPLSIMRQN